MSRRTLCGHTFIGTSNAPYASELSIALQRCVDLSESVYTVVIKVLVSYLGPRIAIQTAPHLVRI